MWSTQLIDDHEVTFWRISSDVEEGCPGTLTTSVTYRLNRSALSVKIRATADAVNPSHFP